MSRSLTLGRVATGLVGDSSGNVILGNTTISNGAGWGRMAQIYDAQYPSLSLKNSYRQWDLTTYGSAGALLFYDTTAGAERARIDVNGRFGLGVTSPAFRLDVSGTNDIARLTASAAGQMLAMVQSSANPVIMRMTNNSSNFWDTQVNTDNSISWDYNDSERARIDSSGRFLVGTNYTPSNYPSKGTSVSGGVLHYHECSFGGATKTVTFSGDFNYFCELTITVWGNAGSGIYQGRFLAGRRDWTGANHQANYADLVGSQLDYSLSTSDSGNTRTFTATFNQANDSANLHWSIEAKVRNLLSFSIS